MSNETNRTENQIAYLEFVLDYFYQSIGPADSEIMQMAKDAWVEKGGVIPEKYLEE